MKNDKGVGQKMTRNGRKMNLTIVTTRLGESVFSKETDLNKDCGTCLSIGPSKRNPVASVNISVRPRPANNPGTTNSIEHLRLLLK